MTDAPRPPSLPGARVLFVRGLLSEAVVRLEPFGVDYMGAQARWCAAQGASVAAVPCPTADAVASNAGRVRAALLADRRPAILVAHSKGGLEALAALLDPEAARRARALIAMQSPFAGSPVADALVAAGPLHAAARLAGRALGAGRGAGLRDLCTDRRAAWLRDNAAALARLLEAVPVVCVAAVVGRDAAAFDRLYLPLAGWMARRGDGPGDGLVPVASALLPGARHLVVPGGHRAPVSSGRGRDPVGVLRRALDLAVPA